MELKTSQEQSLEEILVDNEKVQDIINVAIKSSNVDNMQNEIKNAIECIKDTTDSTKINEDAILKQIKSMVNAFFKKSVQKHAN